ncbi:alcohol acyltransferase 9 [Andrographis paniculata]|uniref:alcohol acyltransferase 9 n=1 Tax=Andrographis paniculata TaxID=175694 RepID=UPI0021E98E0B|nr:alcohol acyltransferase 9 [Andrographis paniculata]
MFKSGDDHRLPDCVYVEPPASVRPAGDTPKHVLYLSNLDHQKFLRFQIRYLYVFKRAVTAAALKDSLSRILVPYYPLAGRLRRCAPTETHHAEDAADDDDKLEIDCNGEGAIFSAAKMDITAEEFLQLAVKPNRSLRKLLCSAAVEPQSFLDIPPLVVQVTNLRCGGMILCTAISHCFCDGIGTSQFLHAWAHETAQLGGASSALIQPFHSRHVLKPRSPPRVSFPHPGFTNITPDSSSIHHVLQSQPLIPSSLTFSTAQILRLKRRLPPSIKCTTFEVLACHTWRCWVRSLGLHLHSSMAVKLLFSVNVRKVFDEMPQGYYGNGFVLASAEADANELVAPAGLHDGVKLVQQAKSRITAEYVRSMIDLMEEDPTVRVDQSSSLVISQWSRLGLHELDFGQGKPLHMGPLSSYIYCVFLPVIGESDAVRVLLSMPESVVYKFEFYMTELSSGMFGESADQEEEEEDANKQYGVGNLKMVSV